MLNKDVKRNVDLKKKSDRWSLDQKMFKEYLLLQFSWSEKFQ